MVTNAEDALGFTGDNEAEPVGAVIAGHCEPVTTGASGQVYRQLGLPDGRTPTVPAITQADVDGLHVLSQLPVADGTEPIGIVAESVKSNETSGCLRGLWGFLGGCGRLVDPRLGWHLARPGRAVEPFGVSPVGGVQGGGAAGLDGDPGAVVR